MAQSYQFQEKLRDNISMAMAGSNIFNKNLLTLLSNKSNLLSEMPMGTTLSLRTSLEMLDRRRCHSDKPSQFKFLGHLS